MDRIRRASSALGSSPDPLTEKQPGGHDAEKSHAPNPCWNFLVTPGECVVLTLGKCWQRVGVRTADLETSPGANSGAGRGLLNNRPTMCQAPGLTGTPTLCVRAV